MDANTTKALVSYVAAAEPHLKKIASYDQVGGEIAQAVDGLVAAGVISASMKEASVAAIQQDPVEAVKLLTKSAAALETAQSVGEATTKKASSAPVSREDAFDAALLGSESGIRI